jgi:hypothetical protein
MEKDEKTCLVERNHTCGTPVAIAVLAYMAHLIQCRASIVESRVWCCRMK